MRGPSGGGGASPGARWDALPAQLLRRIAEEVLALAKSELMAESDYCTRCSRPFHFGCRCTDERAGFWPDNYARKFAVEGCVRGWVEPRLTTEHVEAYRMATLGTTQSMRRVSRYWRDVIGYDLIDDLRMDVLNDELDYSQDLPIRRRFAERDKTAARPLSLPHDFGLRFNGVVYLNLFGTLLETLPDIRPMMRLTALNLDQHFMGALPSWVSDLRLTDLCLSCGHICERWNQNTGPTAQEQQIAGILRQRQ